jgi:hypothetical protein
VETEEELVLRLEEDHGTSAVVLLLDHLLEPERSAYHATSASSLLTVSERWWTR